MKETINSRQEYWSPKIQINPSKDKWSPEIQINPSKDNWSPNRHQKFWSELLVARKRFESVQRRSVKSIVLNYDDG